MKRPLVALTREHINTTNPRKCVNKIKWNEIIAFPESNRRWLLILATWISMKEISKDDPVLDNQPLIVSSLRICEGGFGHGIIYL